MGDRFEFYKEVYFFEHERKNSLLNAHGIPIGLITVLLGVISFYINDLISSDINVDWLFWLFVIFFLAAILCIIFAFFQLISSYTGHQYGYIPYLNELHKYDTANKKYHKGKEEIADKEFYDNLIIEIVKTTSHNSLKNEQRSVRLFKANIRLIAACFFIGLSAIPYFINKTKQLKEDQTHNIKIVNFNENNKNLHFMLSDKDADNDNNSGDSGDNENQETKPQFPSSHYLYENSMPNPNSSNERNKQQNDTSKGSNKSSNSDNPKKGS